MVEQRVEKSDRERVEERCNKRRRQPDGKEARPRPEKCKESAPYPGPVQSCLGVSNATGNTTSSGDTPPCRNAPRYLAWYSLSFVG